jgi:benzoate-CoA ligase
MTETVSRLVSPAKPMNLAHVYLDRLVEGGLAERTALIVDDPVSGVRRVSYGELAAESARYGHELAARGIGLEDRVFLILEDGLEWAAAFFGAQRVGATTMFLNPRTTAEELAFYLADSRARAVITSSAVAKLLPVERRFLRTVIEVDDPATARAIKSHPAKLAPAGTYEEDFAIWLYSSGSTGAPKAAVHRAYDFVYNTERYAKDVLGMTERDVTLSVPKLFFGYATGSNLLFPLWFGGTAILFPDKPTPERLFELAAKHKATILISVPTMIAQMAELYEKEPRWDLAAMRVVTSAGEALPPELYKRWRKSVGPEILDGIGSAEMFHIFISTRFGEVADGSLGTLVPGYEARIVDGDGETCAPGQVGTLWVRGGSAAAFYWQRHQKSRDVLRGEWVVTGDQFVEDSAGRFFYRGRADDLMKVAGRWLAPQEIEDLLVKHPAVAEAGAAPFVQDGLTKPMAFVILRAGHAPSEELARSLSEHVAAAGHAYKAPRFVEFVSALPRSDRDKLARGELKKMATAAALRRGLAGAEG